MVGLVEKIQQRRDVAYPVAAGLLAALVLLPLLGSFGLWDPQEFPVADVAREVARTGDYASVYETRPALSIWLSAIGISTLGPSELSVRLPHALLGLVAALAAYGAGRRLRSPRAGLLAAIVLVSLPLFVFEARQLTTDMGAIAGSALVLFGVLGLGWPAAPRSIGVVVGDVACVVVGLVLGFFGLGLPLGVGVPAIAVALASTAAASARGEDATPSRARHIVLAAGAGVIAAVALYMWWSAGLLKGYQPLLGGAFRGGEPPASATFDVLIDQLAFGLFPWSAVAPIAVVRLALVRRLDRQAWGGLVVLAWALAAWALGTLWVREMADLRYPGLVAIAVATGVLLDDWLAAREGEPDRLPGAALGMPLAALFVFCAAFQLARDIVEFPAELASVHLLAPIKWPEVLGTHKVVRLLGQLFALAFALGVALRSPIGGDDGTAPKAGLLADVARWLQPVARWAIHAAIGFAFLGALVLSLIYTPRLSEHFSYKNVFDAYHRVARGGEALAVMGIPGSGPDFYARGKLERVNDLGGFVSFLQGGQGRVFGVGQATDLCAIHQAAGQNGFTYHVPFAGNSRYFLYSNQLGPGEKDENPLAEMILRTPPADVSAEPIATFKPAVPGQRGELQLVGVRMPPSAKKGGTFKMSLIFKVIERPSAGYQIFVHFDKGVRFQGDHWPLKNLCGTQYWQPGDYVVDTFEVEAGSVTTPRGTFNVFMGFFTGGAGNWKNMTVVSGKSDGRNRVNIGQIQVR